ncbi:MAG: HAMP domain-containing protein [Ignavibacteria bacterium]|nr:HAMP domain-containing protein [Ignavibacteria bacterium]
MKLYERIKKSIRLKMISGVVITLVLVITFVSLYFPAKQRSMSLDTIQKQVNTLSEMLSFSVGMGLGESNFTLVQNTFSWAQKDKNVIYILIQDESNAEIVSYNPQNISVDPSTLQDIDKTIRTDEAITSYTTIKYNEEKLGKIVLVYSLNEVNNAILDNSYFSLVISILIFAFGVIVILWLTKVITRQINKLNAAAQQITNGELNVDLDVKSEDELGNLANSFKKMIQSINEANEKLVNEKNNIALKVEEAVRESEKQKLYLSHNIDYILNEMNKLAEGDLTVNLEIKNEKDIIGKLFFGFNRVVENIRQMIINVTEAVQSTAIAVHEISSSAEEIASGSHEQSSQTNEVASAVEEMTATIITNTQNTTSAADFSKKSGQSALHGGQVVKQTVDGMNRIAQVVGDAALIVKKLGTSSDQIGEIIQVIDEIADQTNLLALNAAIEAARAGEQGRGFAVVADEVRKLAERTSKATKEIAAMINTIQSDTGNAVKSIDSGTEEVEKGKSLANKAISALDEIIENTNETIDVINQVAASSEEQSATAEQISKSIHNISRVTQESSTSIQQIARASEDLSNLTSNLQNLVNIFKLNTDKADNRTDVNSIKGNPRSWISSR